MSTVLQVHKAQPLTENDSVPGVVIHIEIEFPQTGTLMDNRATMQRDADDLATELYQNLPGGTLTLLIAELLRRENDRRTISNMA
jgi:hypothetical protein